MKITFMVSGNIRSNFVYRSMALARALHKLGHEVLIVAPKADKYNNFTPETTRSIDGVSVLQPFQFVTKRMEINFLPYLFGATMIALRKKSDFIYIYKPTPVNIVGFIAKLFKKTPIIVDMDDLGSEVMKIEGHPWFQRKFVEWSENFATKHADRLVVASSYLFNKYRRKFPEKLIHLMPNGVEADWFAPLIPSKEKQRVVFMGQINRKNILEPLFNVFPAIIKQYPLAKALIMGDGKDLEYFKKKTKELGIDSHITFTGWLALNAARSNLNAGDIGYNYMPDTITVKAANNMKVSQYMARGVVPLMSEVGDLPSMVDFGRVGYICKADNLEALKTALLRALEDEDKMEKAQQASIFVAQQFNWDHLAEDLCQWLIPEK